MSIDTEDFFVCPGCGAKVRVGSSGCPKCAPKGGKKRRHWEQDEAYDGLDLPDEEDDFDYDGFIADEFGGPPKRGARDIVYLVVGIILLIALVFLWVL